MRLLARSCLRMRSMRSGVHSPEPLDGGVEVVFVAGMLLMMPS